MRHALTLLCTALASPALISPAFADAPGVMTGTPVVHSLVAQVMGDLGTPGLLLDRGADPHAFQLRPSQARALASADLVFWIGPELTPWMARALEGTGTAGRVVGLLGAEGVALRDHDDDAHGDEDDHDHEDDHAHEEEQDHDHDQEHAHDADHDHDHADSHAHEEEHEDDHAHDDEHAHEEKHAHSDDHDHADGHDHDHGHDHSHDGTDPHAWLDPANARLWLDLIAAELGTADPANAAAYAANAAAGKAAIDTAEAQARAALAPVGDAPIMVFHDAYGYFADAFGLNVAGTIALGDAASPGAARLAELRARLVETGTTCVFPEVNHDPAYAGVVLEGSAARLGGLLDPAGVAMDPGAALYPALLTNLAETIAACVGDT